jgi:hypothetical protein
LSGFNRRYPAVFPRNSPILLKCAGEFGPRNGVFISRSVSAVDALPATHLLQASIYKLGPRTTPKTAETMPEFLLQTAKSGQRKAAFVRARIASVARLHAIIRIKYGIVNMVNLSGLVSTHLTGQTGGVIFVEHWFS